jgi:Zn-dependent peptidase ImmA (M78 family)/predicted secreted protein
MARQPQSRPAVLKGMRAALRLQRDLGVDQGSMRGQRIDVFGSILRQNVPLMFQELEPLMGAYLRPGGHPGIILTTRRPLGQQRFTAAHELGHHVLGHDPHADDDSILRRSPDIMRDYLSVPPEEQEADAFASFFLLPDWLIRTQMERHGWTRYHFEEPEIVYQAALRMGVSYSAAIYALVRGKVINASVRKKLAAVQPAKLKRALVPDYPLETTQNIDVWELDERDEGGVIEAGRDDLFVLKLREDSNAGYIWNFDELQQAGFVVLKDGREALSEDTIGAPTVRRVLAHGQDAPQNGTYTLWERRPWAPEEDPKSWSFDYQPVYTHDIGLFRRRMVSGGDVSP